MLCWERKEEAEMSPKVKNSLQAIFQSHASLKLRSSVTGWYKAMISYLVPVWWYLSSRHASSREWKPCISRFQSAFHKEYGLLSFPKCYKRKNNISRERHHTERRRRGGLRQRSSRGLEIDSPIISLICLVLFSLYFSWILS